MEVEADTLTIIHLRKSGGINADERAQGSFVRLNTAGEGVRKGLPIRVLKESAENRRSDNLFRSSC